MTEKPALPKLVGPVREKVEKIALELGYAAEDFARMVLEKETAVPDNYRGQLDRQWAALYGTLVQLQPTMVDQVFAPAGRKKKTDTRAMLPKWAEELFGVAAIETTFIELPDGRILEQIQTRAGPAFAVYTPVPERWEVVPELEVDGTKYFPKPVLPEFLESITFPDGVEAYESPAALVDEMTALARDVFDPADDEELFRLTVRLGFASWTVSHLFPPRYLGGATDRFLPGMQTVGMPQSGKGRRLAIVRQLFYRTVYLLSTTKIPSIFRTISPWGWGSTLVLDEADLPYSGPSSELVEFLNARSYGIPPVRYNSEKDESVPFLTFGYSVIATREPYDDPGWASRVIPLASASSLRPVEPPLVINLEWEARAAKLRRQLLLFRFRTIVAIREGKVKVPDRIPLARHFDPRLRASFIPLFALGDSDPRLTQDVIALATEIGRRQTASRADSWEGVVLGRLYERILDGTWIPDKILSGAHVGCYRLLVNAIKKRGDTKTASADPVEETTPKKETEAEEETEQVPVVLGTLCASLPGEPKAKGVSRILKSVPMKIQAQDRIRNERYRSILIVDNPRRLVDIFSKYVVEPDLESIRPLFGLDSQTTLDKPDPGAEKGVEKA